MKQNTVFTVGSLAFDTIQTPAGKAEWVLGGSVNYFSIAASLYTPVQVVGIVGEDFPSSHLDWLAGRGVDVSGIERVKGKTFHWVGSYDQNLNEAKTLSTALNVFEHFNPKLSEAQKALPYLFLANIDPILQQSVLDQLKQPKLIVADSMNFWITGKPEELKKTLKRVDILSVNEGEAYLLSNQPNLRSAAETILGLGPKVVIIKRGEYGAALFTGNETFLLPAFPVQRVVDPTGAGDSFAGGFVGYLAHHGISRDLERTDHKAWNKALRRAMVAGSVMASFTVEDFSIHRLMHLERQELEAREKAFLNMVNI